MKKVLILGDSISMGYREYVKEMLKGEAEVQFPEENGRFAKYTHWLANQWFRNNGIPDIIHWNNGIWDICIEPPAQGNFTPLDAYIRQLARNIETFRVAGVPVILFATTTFAKEGKKEISDRDVQTYNTAAKALMEKEGIPVTRLDELVEQNKNKYICEDMLHLTEAGYLACAEKVVNAVRPWL